MTILFMGGEMDVAIPSDSTVHESTVAAGFDSSFARCALRTNYASAYPDCVFLSVATDFYTHFDLSMSNGAFTGQHRRVAWLNASDVQCVTFDYDINSTTLTVKYWNGTSLVSAGTIVATLSSTGGGPLQTIDVYIKCNSASGSIKVYIAGTLRLNASVDLSSVASIAKFRTYGGRSDTPGLATWASQIVVSTSSTIGGRLFTVPVASAGSNSDFTGTYAEIDEIAYSDADFINSATANQVSTFSVTAPALTGYAVQAVGVGARAKRGSGGPQNLQLAIRVSGTNYFSSSKALDVGSAGYFNVWETNPATSGAWSNTVATAIQPGVKSIA